MGPAGATFEDRLAAFVADCQRLYSAGGPPPVSVDSEACALEAAAAQPGGRDMRARLEEAFASEIARHGSQAGNVLAALEGVASPQGWQHLTVALGRQPGRAGRTLELLVRSILQAPCAVSAGPVGSATRFVRAGSVAKEDCSIGET